MNAELQERILKVLESVDDLQKRNSEFLLKSEQRMKLLEQENADLKGQLKQWGIDARELANARLANGAKKGLFLK